MAFRKRKKIGKGLHLNFSGNGVGLGFKVMPGLSFSLNSKGMYCNTSIPGTGFYSRNKIGGLSSQPSYGSNVNTENYTPSSQEVELHVHAENDGSYTIKLYDENGELVSENSFLYRAAQRNAGFNQTIARAINDCTEELIDIYKLTAKPLTIEDMQKRVEDLKPKKVLKKSYQVPEPNIDEIRLDLETEAEREINSIFFWQNKKKRRQYVDSKIDGLYNQLKNEWLEAKSAHEQEQQAYFENETTRRQTAYHDACVAFDGFVSDNVDCISANIDNLLGVLNVPFEFSITYDYHSSLKLLRVQLDLPEIANFPQKKATTLVKGDLSIKDKSKSEKASDYAQCVTGMAFFFAGMLFNVSAQIENIEISGYTQQTDPTTGHEIDTYIYSVVFQRSSFSLINYESIDPIMSLQSQPNKSKILKSNEMREITPFTLDEIISIINV